VHITNGGGRYIIRANKVFGAASPTARSFRVLNISSGRRIRGYNTKPHRAHDVGDARGARRKRTRNLGRARRSVIIIIITIIIIIIFITTILAGVVSSATNPSTDRRRRERGSFSILCSSDGWTGGGGYPERESGDAYSRFNSENSLRAHAHTGKTRSLDY